MKNDLLKLISSKILTFRDKENEKTTSPQWEVALYEKFISSFGTPMEAILAVQIAKSTSIIAMMSFNCQ